MKHIVYVGRKMGSQVLAEVVADSLKRLLDQDVQKKFYALIEEFFPLVLGPCSSARVHQHRRIKAQIHRELDSLFFDTQRFLGLCSLPKELPSVDLNDVRKDKCVPSRSLIIQGRWLDKIYGGEKSWELRTKSTRKRGRIGLISSGSGLIGGEAWLIDCFCCLLYTSPSPRDS